MTLMGNLSVADRIAQQYEVEQFLTDEADLLDRWKLNEWLGLFEPECTYVIGPLGIEDPEHADPGNTLFLVSDDHFRLKQRVEMLQKPSAHIEWPHSKTRHMLGNVKIINIAGDAITAQANFIIFRTKRNVTINYMGHAIYTLHRQAAGGFKIAAKRIFLDLDGLVPQGKVSIVL